MKNEPNENILYDPETGEPIYPQPEAAPRFDPETGLPLEQAEPAANRFDPDTGLPLGQSRQNAPVPDQFDPETGLPLGNNHPTDTAPDLFDPETGLPVRQASPGNAIPDRFDPETGLPLGQNPPTDSVPDLFDPETGLPLGQGAASPDRFDPDTGLPIGSSVAPDRFDPNTGRPIGRGAARAAGAAGRGLLHGKTLAVAGAGIIVLATGGTAIAGGGHLMKNKKDIVSDALTGIVETMDDGYLEQTFGLKDLQELAAGGDCTMGVAFDFDGLSRLGLPDPLAVDVNLSKDTKKDAALLSAAVKAGGMDLGTFSLYADNQMLAAAAPELISPVLTLDYQNRPDKRVESSFMGEQLNIESEDFKYVAEVTGTVQEAVMGKKRYFDISELYDRYKETTKAADTLKNAMEVEKLDSKRFTVDGKTQKCRGYHVVVSHKDLADFVKTAGKYLVTDDEIQDNEMARIKDILTIIRMVSGNHYDSADSWADEQMDKLKDAIRSGSDEIEAFFDDNVDDLDMILYVNKKGNAAHLEVTTSIDTGKLYEIEAAFDFEGGSIPTRVMNGTLTADSGSERLGLKLDKTEKNTKDLWQSDWDIVLSDDSSDIRLSLTLEHDKRDDEFQLEANIDDVKLELGGEFLDYTKGKSIEIAVDTAQLDTGWIKTWMNDRDSFSMFLKPLSEDVEIPKGKQIDILDADEDDWTDMQRELERNFDIIRSY